MPAQCSAHTTTGDPCAAQPIRPDGYCYWHSPETAAERAAARRKGGLNKSNKTRAAKALPAEPMTDQELHVWLGVVFRKVITGTMQPGVATAAASVAKAMVSVRQASELEERLAQLEQQAGLVSGSGWRA